jgi:hypothetical protein
MPWARFEDDYLGNQKLATLTTAAIALDMAAIVYSARELRDGQLTVTDVQAIATLIHIRRWQPVAAELVRVNRWATPDGACYAIHDYLEYQPSRQQVLTERAAAAQRMRRVRDKSGRSSPERSPELRKKFGDPGPGPGPGPGPERSPNVPGTSPQPPPQAAGEAPPTGAQNGSTLELPPRPPRKAEPAPPPTCCPNFAATGSEHWQFCPNAAVEVP